MDLLSHSVCLCGLETEGLRLLESESWPCIGGQVKDDSPIMVWTACKGTHMQ